MYVVYINLLYFLSIFLLTYNKNLLSQKIIYTQWVTGNTQQEPSFRHISCRKGRFVHKCILEWGWTI